MPLAPTSRFAHHLQKRHPAIARSAQRVRLLLLGASLAFIAVAYLYFSRAALQWMGSRSFPEGATNTALALRFTDEAYVPEIPTIVEVPKATLPYTQINIVLSPPLMRVTDSGTLAVAVIPSSAQQARKEKDPKIPHYSVALIAPKAAIEINPEEPIQQDEDADMFVGIWSLSPKKVGDYEVLVKGLPPAPLAGTRIFSFHEQANGTSEAGESRSLIPKVSGNMPEGFCRIGRNGTVVIKMSVLDEFGLTARQHIIVKAGIAFLALVVGAIVTGVWTGLFTAVGDHMVQSFKSRRKRQTGVPEQAEQQQGRLIVLTDADVSSRIGGEQGKETR